MNHVRKVTAAYLSGIVITQFEKIFQRCILKVLEEDHQLHVYVTTWGAKYQDVFNEG